MHSLAAWPHLFTLFYIVSMNSVLCALARVCATSLFQHKSTNILTYTQPYVFDCISMLYWYVHCTCRISVYKLAHKLCHQHQQQQRQEQQSHLYFICAHWRLAAHRCWFAFARPPIITCIDTVSYTHIHMMESYWFVHVAMSSFIQLHTNFLLKYGHTTWVFCSSVDKWSGVNAICLSTYTYTHILTYVCG